MSVYSTEVIERIAKVSLTPAGCAVDLGDGSERAEYVNQDYILHKMGRPHRNVSIMYTYYPLDQQWPERISEACKDMDIQFQWDYPYDDYPTYGGGIGGDLHKEPFNQIKDIRRHGQDVTLTLTIDCSVGDEHLIKIAEDLRHFGRIQLRINHECAGNWFTHNQRYSYQEIADFYVRFVKILKEHAPNVITIFCAGFAQGEGKVEKEDEFLEAYKCADIWSGDRYLALHYGWPFDVCECGGNSFSAHTLDSFYGGLKDTAARLRKVTGQEKPLVVSEFNLDGDVTGPREQMDAVNMFMDQLADEKPDWFRSFCLYQFRDRGRLGLEIEDPNNNSVGIEQPILKAYKEQIHRDYFLPGMEEKEEIEVMSDKSATVEPILLRWGGAEDADGAAFEMTLEKDPTFFEIHFEEELNLMIEVNGRWFYKAPGTSVVDCMSAFFAEDAKKVEPGQKITVRMFATPEDGVNPETEREDWDVNYYTEMKCLPEFRVRYTPVAIIGRDFTTRL